MDLEATVVEILIQPFVGVDVFNALAFVVDKPKFGLVEECGQFAKEVGVQRGIFRVGLALSKGNFETDHVLNHFLF